MAAVSSLTDFIADFDKRAASVILDAANPASILHLQQKVAGFGAYISDLNNIFLQQTKYGLPNPSSFYTPTVVSLAMMAYDDFFPNDDRTLLTPIPTQIIEAQPSTPPIAPGRAGERIGCYLRDLINVAIMNASPGYCGTYGPSGLIGNLLAEEGNYDMTQAHLIPIAYSYYDELHSDVREHLIGKLLAGGIIHRESEPDIHTSGPLPNDWTRAGYISASDLAKAAGAAAIAAAGAQGVAAAPGEAAQALAAAAQALAAVAQALAAVAGAVAAAAAAAAAALADLAALVGGAAPAAAGTNFKDLGETENHIISMLSARYLTNQLLYQRNPIPVYDNRRNAIGGPTCMSLVLSELRNILRDDFSEYNAKPYQEETRWPILNLATYAYDYEVRLAARMVLDYISARVAVSSNDLRRIVPFRRRNEDWFVEQAPNSPPNDTQQSHMANGIVDTQLGADPMAAYFAIQTGNVRAYETPNPQLLPSPPFAPNLQARPQTWGMGIATGGGDETKEVLSSYRLPPLILDLFVNDLHRRFFQRLHRTRQTEAEGSRNCDNYELYASSPSYLITAGGQPATYALDPYFFGVLAPNQTQQIGVAMPTTFMPTGQSAEYGTQNSADQLIQLSYFSDKFNYNGKNIPEYLNYGVAPDFACGYGLYLPPWALSQLDAPLSEPGFHFIKCGSSDGTSAGFFLAILTDGNYALLEALDTWLHPEVTFAGWPDSFQTTVKAQNASISSALLGGVSGDWEGVYTTYHGTQIEFKIWSDHTNGASPDSKAGASTKNIVYSDVYPTDSQGDAGNVIGPFLNGTILNSSRDAVVEISNPFYEQGAKIVLDLSDPTRPRRTSETGEVEEAGDNNEVWVNFGWTGPTEGDFFHPFNTLTAAIDAVAPGGVIKVVPGWTTERPAFLAKKRYKIVAPIGGVRFGVV